MNFINLILLILVMIAFYVAGGIISLCAISVGYLFGTIVAYLHCKGQGA